MSENGAQVLGRISGLSEETVREIWEDVKKNHALLDACERHRFEDMTPGKPLGKKYKCSACGGTADAVAVRWYELGFKHGVKSRKVEESWEHFPI